MVLKSAPARSSGPRWVRWVALGYALQLALPCGGCGGCGGGSSDRAQPPASTAAAPAPTLSSTPSTDERALIAGPHTTCLRDGSAVECWGQNLTAQLGEVGEPCEDSRCIRSPRFMPELGEVRDLVFGGFHSCVLDPMGGVACLGGDHDGQIGGVARAVCTVGGYAVPQAFLDPATGEITYEGTQEVAAAALPCASTPTRVEALAGSSAIFAGGATTCARRGAALLCAGGSALRALGAEATPDRCRNGACARRFVPVLAGQDVEDIQFGTYGACWRTASGEARCAGGQLESLRAEGVSAIAVGHEHACFLERGGGIECGGWNAEGSVGNGEITEPTAPAVPLVRVLEVARAVVAGSGHTCAIMRDDTLQCWGANAEGQLGVGDTEPRTRPTAVPALGGVVEVALGTHHTCARTRDGAVYCWGSHRYGELGVGADAPEICTSGVLSAPRIPCSTRPVRVERAP